MPEASESALFSLLPASRPPWKEFVLSMGTEGLALALLLSLGILRPAVLASAAKEYKLVPLVSVPPTVNHDPQPLRALARPVETLRVPAISRDVLRAPAPTTVRDEPAPKILAEAKAPQLVPSTPVIPRELVKTNVFSTGSSAPPTIAKAPQQVQTGGFGDPNGVPAQANNNGKPATIAQLGSFDLPAGGGYGNGTGGARGARGVVASAGFGNGTAVGDGSGRASASRGTVRQAGFGDMEQATAVAKAKPAEAAPLKVVPAEILSKPTPEYSEEARKLHIEGEVLLEVVLEASGRLRVLRVVRGLGHGLDEAAAGAAEQIRFKPALRDGQPADSTAVLHVVFQLA